jgi:GNAT superfamily N-acetyltransferase
VTETPERIRSATEADLDAINALIAASEGALDGTDPSPSPTEIPYLRHLVRRGVTAVAESGSELLGFGATVATERWVHLADLWVLPGHQGRGIGRRLLADVFADAPSRTTFASSDPRALPLYVRFGMLPRWPNYVVRGDATRLPAPSGLEVIPIDTGALIGLEVAWIGVDRGPEVPFWESLVQVRPFAVQAGDRTVAAGLSRRRLDGKGWWIDHAHVAPDVDGLEPLLAAIRHAGADGGEVGASILGPNLLIRALLDVGFQVKETDTFMSTHPDVIDPLRTLVNTGLL